MLRNYFVTSIRSLRRHFGFTVISVLGLAVAMSVSLLLILFVRDQAGKDTFHEDADRLYRVYSDFKASHNKDNALYATAPAGLADRLKSDLPEVEDATHIRASFGGTVVNRGEPLNLGGLYADPAFLRMFDFGLQAGDPAAVLSTPNSIVLTPGEAQRLFGRVNVVDEVLQFENGNAFTVTGVFERDDFDTLIPLSAVASLETLETDSAGAGLLGDWTRSIYESYTYVKLRPGADADAFESTIQRLIPTYYAEEGGNRIEAFRVQSVTDINLGTLLGNELGVVFPGVLALFLLALAAVILSTACFNYVGLSVSRSLERAREVGVRKVFGAVKRQLFGQFITESLLVCGIAVALAAVMLVWLEGQFNDLAFMRLAGIRLEIGYFSDPGLYAVFIAFAVLVALAAGTYPALYLARFQPSEAVRGTAALSSSGGSRLRKSLVVVQFAVSIVFVIVTIVMVRQSRTLLDLDYGFETEEVVNVKLQDVPYDRFRDRLASSSVVSDVAGVSVLPAMGRRSDTFVWNPGDEEPTRAYVYNVTPNYPALMEIDVLAGRELRPEDRFEETRNVLVNQLLLDALNLGEAATAVGESVVYSDSADIHIVGVVENIRTNPALMEHSPILLAVEPESINWASLRVVPGRMDDVDGELEAAWAALGSLQQLEYDVFDVQLKSNFVNELTKNILRIVTFVAFLSIVIALLGLLGIASLNVQKRTREISIRKILGATTAHLIGLLSREFVVLMGIALVIAVPLGWVLSNAFLSAYAVQAGIGPIPVVVAIAGIGLLAFATISSQTVRAALEDPVHALQQE